MVKCFRIRTFWTVFFALLAVLAIACGVATAILQQNQLKRIQKSTVSDENYYKITTENAWRQSLYLTCDSLKNIDASLGKVAISHDQKHQAEMLANVAVCANEVNNQLANLPFAEGDNLASCEKFSNQTQDYATYLVGRLAGGNSLTAEERKSLKSLQRVAYNLYNLFEDYANSDSAMFMTNGVGLDGIGDLADTLNNAQDDAFTYEKLIYDGPFSDSIQQKQLTCGKKISHAQGSEIVTKWFGENTFYHEIKGDCLMYVYKTESGEVTLTADGNVVEYDSTQNFEGKKVYDGKKCITIAEEFCKTLGYDVQGVWVSNTQDYVTYVNCAPVIDEVIIYPELVKVAVDTSSGQVVGLEAKSYIINHQDRDVKFGKITANEAQKQLDGLKVTNVAKALVELKGETYLCHEFECTDGANQYYLYIDSNTGREVQIFKVVQNTEGHTVI